MKLQEVIRRLCHLKHHPGRNLSVEDVQAISIGFEALKRIRKDRKGIITFPDELLPSETKE